MKVIILISYFFLLRIKGGSARFQKNSGYFKDEPVIFKDPHILCDIRIAWRNLRKL